MTDIWLFVGGLFLVGALIIAVLGRRNGAAAQAELWAYFGSEFLIVAAVLVPAALHPLLFVACGVAAAARFAWEIRRAARERGTARPMVDAVFVLLVMLSALGLLRLATLEAGVRLLVLMFVCTEMQDAMAFLVGRIFGRTHFLPRLSPRKTLEGTLGGLLGGALPGAAFGHYFLQWNWMHSAVVALVCTVGGLAGDLAASAYKRQVGVKDFAPIHHLHGGLLDVYDSLVLCAPWMLGALWLTGGGL